MMRCAGLATALCLAFSTAAPAGEAEIVSPPTRDVTAPGMTPAEIGTGPLIRIPSPPPPPDPPRWRKYILPVTTDAATFLVHGLSIHLADVTPLAADATCPLPDEASWPCGQTALFSLRQFLHGRTVECFHAAVASSEISAPCRVGRTDLALWLLRQGWAEAGSAANAEYRAAVVTARCVGAGRWRATVKPADCPAS